MLRESLADFPGQIQTRKAGVFLFELFDNAQALAVVLETAVAFHQPVQRRLTPVAKRRMAEIMGERDGLRQVLVQLQRAGDVPGNRRDLNRMRQARAQVIARAVQENLGLVFEPAEGARVDDTVTIPLVLGAPVRRGFAVFSAAAFRAELGVRGEQTLLNLFEFLACARHDSVGSSHCSEPAPGMQSGAESGGGTFRWGEATDEPSSPRFVAPGPARAFAATKPLRRRRREDARPTESCKTHHCPESARCIRAGAGWNALLDLERLLEKLREMIQNGGIAGDQGGAGSASGFLDSRGRIIGKSDDGNMPCFRFFFQRGDGPTDVIPAGNDVRQHHHRLFLAGAGQQRARIGHRPDAIFEILQPVHQLSSGQQ